LPPQNYLAAFVQLPIHYFLSTLLPKPPLL
jgi:hypothetical protein